MASVYFTLVTSGGLAKIIDGGISHLGPLNPSVQEEHFPSILFHMS
jgi:hypothetical protein